MRPITQQQWQLIRTIVATGRLTAAARQLGISEPAASKTVRLLETRLGVPLFDRVGRTLRPTRFGLEFSEAGARIVETAERVARRADLVGRGVEGEVTVGCGGFALSAILPAVLGRVLTERPAVRVQAAVESFPELLHGLAEWRLDLVVADSTGFGDDALRGYAWRTLPPLPSPVVARPGHPILRRRAPTVVDLLDYSWALPTLPPRAVQLLQTELERLPAERRLELERRLQEQPHVRLADPQACLELAARTDCLTGAPEPLAQPWLDGGRLVRVRMRLAIVTNAAVIWDPRRTVSPAAERLRKALLA